MCIHDLLYWTHKASLDMQLQTVLNSSCTCISFLLQSCFQVKLMPTDASMHWQVSVPQPKPAKSAVSLSMDLLSAMKCQAAFLRQILQPAIVNKDDLWVSTTAKLSQPEKVPHMIVSLVVSQVKGFVGRQLWLIGLSCSARNKSGKGCSRYDSTKSNSHLTVYQLYTAGSLFKTEQIPYTAWVSCKYRYVHDNTNCNLLRHQA